MSKRFFASSGSRTKKLYESHFNGSHLTLQPKGEMDTQQLIEAQAPYCDLNYMLHRLSIGDTSVLSRKAPLIGSFAGLPDNPIDYFNVLHNAEHSFLQLSDEEKQKYNNDYRVWVTSLFSDVPNPDAASSGFAAPDPEVK